MAENGCITFGSIYRGNRFGDVPLPYVLWIIDSINEGKIDITQYPELRDWVNMKRRMILAKRNVFNKNAIKEMYKKFEEDFHESH